ncbi:hypothetical protein AAEX63_01775 [Luteococcus sp. H138]|uniref:hypothetical protein n=1 Tax=Luteococcus sp. H138 TaxID=3139404 RepID=UPI00313C4CEE
MSPFPEAVGTQLGGLDDVAAALVLSLMEPLYDGNLVAAALRDCQRLRRRSPEGWYRFAGSWLWAVAHGSDAPELHVRLPSGMTATNSEETPDLGVGAHIRLLEANSGMHRWHSYGHARSDVGGPHVEDDADIILATCALPAALHPDSAMMLAAGHLGLVVCMRAVAEVGPLPTRWWEAMRVATWELRNEGLLDSEWLISTALNAACMELSMEAFIEHAGGSVAIELGEDAQAEDGE